MRDEMTLNGCWRCMPDKEDQGRKQGYHRVDFDFMDKRGSCCGSRMWREVTIPCCYSHCGPDMRQFVGRVWFRKSFQVPSAWKDRNIFIRFEALNFLAHIWLNDMLIKTSYDGFLPLELNLNKFLKFGEENTLIIRTDNTERPDDRSPGGGLGYYFSGGLVSDVKLFAVSRVYLESARFAMAEPGTGHEGVFLLNNRVVNTLARPSRVLVKVRIKDRNKRVCGVFLSESRFLAPHQAVTIPVTGRAAAIKPWSPDTPELYHAEIELVRDGTVTDGLTERFGFRKIETRDNKLYLNGHEVFIKGITYHSAYGFDPSSSSEFEPEITFCRAALLADLKAIKALGCNFVRLGHVPRIAPELDLFDEIGLMCSVENNLHWWQNEIANKLWKRLKITDRHVRRIGAHARRQLRKLIMRDMNHPAVILWSVCNECRPDKKGVLDTIRSCLRLAHRLDPSRLTAHVSAEWHSQLGTDDFSCDDVLMINSYIRERGFWDRELAALRRRYPDKPIVVAEFGCNNDDDDIQAKWIKEYLAIIGGVAGSLAGFCLYVYNTVIVHRYRSEPRKGQLGNSYNLFDTHHCPRKSAFVYQAFLKRFRKDVWGGPAPKSVATRGRQSREYFGL